MGRKHSDDMMTLEGSELDEVLDSTRFDASFDSADGESESFIRQYISFPEFGITIPLFGIQSVEKESRFLENSLRWEYGIVFNKGVNPSVSSIRSDIAVWYNDEKTRDRVWESIHREMNNLGFRVKQIK